MTRKLNNYNFLIIPSIIIIVLSILPGAGSVLKEDILKSLLIERTSVLQDYYFGMVSKEETYNKLLDFETYPIITEDIESFDDHIDTDFDRVIKMSFEDIELKSSFMGYISYEAEIVWDMRSPEGEYRTSGRYHVVLLDEGDRIFLSKFELIE
ncbi:MAG: hypothetical protein E7225_04865 [Clostridiales bacterium]|nr:hypothetical protein [Clostridiales bacterium]